MSTTSQPTKVEIPTAGVYVLDPATSSITFATRHLFGLGGVTGTFTLRSGEITVTDPFSESRVHAVVDASSFTTDKPKRDEHVRSNKLLDATAYPDLAFRSTGLHQVDGGWVLTGELTARGTTAPAELSITGVAAEGDALALAATSRIDRYAHGVAAAKGMAGRHLDLTFVLRAHRA